MLKNGINYHKHQHREGGLKMKFVLALYRFLYAITLDRRWVIRYVDIMNKKIKKEIQQFYASKEK